MRINFEIKEKLSEIVAEITCSDKWYTLVKEEKEDQKHLAIKDPYFQTEASIEIRRHEIYIRSSWSENYMYHICQKGGSVWCEYTGPHKGLLTQKLLPCLTPKEKRLDWVMRHRAKVHTQRTHPARHDEFIKIGVPMPPIAD